MPDDSETYLIDSPEEMLRLERQAAIYGTVDDLSQLALRGNEHVLDAGCGAGALARMIARALPGGHVTGLDRQLRYLDYARRAATSADVPNVDFVPGDVLSLPFEDNRFDLVWSKHLLQWVADRERALEEFVRVARPGGRVIAANFDGFLTQHHPEDPDLQRGIARWFEAARSEIGFDNWLGRKLPRMFLDAGLVDVRVHTIPDKAFSGLGGSAERRWNLEVQSEAVMDFTARVCGSNEAAREFWSRFIERFDDPQVYFHCTLFYVEGRVPG